MAKQSEGFLSREWWLKAFYVNIYSKTRASNLIVLYVVRFAHTTNPASNPASNPTSTLHYL